MRRLTILSLCAIVIGALVIALGCSSDKSTNEPLPQPNQATADFVASSVGTSLIDGANESIHQTLELFDFPVGSPNRPSIGSLRAADSSAFDTVIYTYTDGHHAFYFVSSVTETLGSDTLWTATLRGWDTVTLWNNGVAQPDRDTTTDSIRANLVVEYAQSGPGFEIMAWRKHGVGVDGNPWTDSSFGVDGSLLDSARFSISNDSGSCELKTHSTGSVVDVVLDSNVIYNDACPSSGGLNFNAALALTCQGNGGSGMQSLTINGNWGIDVTWDGVVQTTHLTHNGAVFNSTDSCGTEPSLAKLGPWLQAR